VNVQGKDRKTALYWAVEKSHAQVVKFILGSNPELEAATKVTISYFVFTAYYIYSSIEYFIGVNLISPSLSFSKKF
jgi:hypothetical protein